MTPLMISRSRLKSALGLPSRALLAACLFLAGFAVVAACGGPSGGTTIPNSQRLHITTAIGGTLTTVVTGP